MNSRKWKRELPLHLLLLPGFILVLIYAYAPMVGIIMSFQRFVPVQGLFKSKWVGLDNFKYLVALPGTFQVLWNTVLIAAMEIVVGLAVPIAIALLLNEVGQRYVKKSIQTFIYLPHFLSWVILGGILVDILSPSHGVVNQFLKLFGVHPIFFLGSNHWFRFTLVLANEWKEFGFSTIVYLAALTSINPNLYEAAVLDGANRWKQTVHVTLPGMVPIIILMATLSMGNILNAGFDEVFNLYSPIVYQTGDILDTLIYRIGLVNAQYGVSTAIGLFKSLVSFIFISVSYIPAYRLANYRIF